VKTAEKKLRADLILVDQITLERELSADSERAPHVIQTLVSNSVTEESYTDYAHEYFYNAEIPFLGSNNSQLALSSTGTLTSVQAQADESGLATLLNTATQMLPVSGWLSKVLKLPAAANIGAKALTGELPTKEPIYSLSITAVTKSFLYKMTRYSDFTPLSLSDSSNKKPLHFGDTNLITNVTLMPTSAQVDTTANQSSSAQSQQPAAQQPPSGKPSKGGSKKPGR
jgi:hypothetical protein